MLLTYSSQFFNLRVLVRGVNGSTALHEISPHLLAQPLVVPAELLDGELRPRLGLGQLRDLVTNTRPVSGYCLQVPGDS